MNEIHNRLSELGIIPVVKIEDADKAVPLARALADGGLPCMEITYRTLQAEEAIRRVASSMPGMLLGAGTVLTIEQAKSAIDAGARFIVSPGLNPEVVKYCLERKATIIPGCSNPSDIEKALSMGISVVKFFPAEALGGVKTIKAISAPFSDVRFIPTGGINEKNLNDYLSCPSVLACGGSWIASEEMIKAGEFDKITALTQKAVKLMLGFQLEHVGINSKDPEEAAKIAELFGAAFGLQFKEGNTSFMADNMIEVVKQPSRGRNGHIAIGTNNVKRAVAYFQSRKYKMDLENAKTTAGGELKAVYFEEEFGGFAVHLVQKSGGSN
ncbi:MAG: bifunctional 4-hydroxy-2-oxoglutarate aldolase/2-dehydro-3-deoxy-phosphogluconate aldolase [Bacillota bacterium]